ncbi:THO complex subunit 1 isoform X2 [Iris pallida]|uniref:THO complex subunit 1 isoform X2 n=1 Tax=Iris pallida TaxID=29817 RepID=A0AAX6HFR8_IRIPA|nr:THO complex subunit 1 isoform X2 [Iris pallida]
MAEATSSLRILLSQPVSTSPATPVGIASSLLREMSTLLHFRLHNHNHMDFKEDVKDFANNIHAF